MDHTSPNCLVTGSAWRNFNERLGIAALHLVELFKKQVTGESVADPLFNVYLSCRGPLDRRGDVLVQPNGACFAHEDQHTAC